MGISVPVSAFEEVGATITRSMVGTPEEKMTGRRRLPGGGFAAFGMGGVVWLEASLPKREYGENIEALGLDAALDAMEGVYREAAGFFEYDRRREGHRFERCKVIRIDAVRDFENVSRPGQLLDGLAGVPVEGRVRRKRFADAERNRAQTLTNMTSRWSSTLYDKHEESLGKAEPGRLRFEARMRSPYLMSEAARRAGGNVLTVADITEDKVRSLRRDRFERVGYDREVKAPGRLLEVVEASGLSPAEQRNLWAFLTMTAAGGDPGFGYEAAAKYRRIARDLGVTSAAFGTDVGAAVIALDYDEGREVLRVA